MNFSGDKNNRETINKKKSKNTEDCGKKMVKKRAEVFLEGLKGV